MDVFHAQSSQEILDHFQVDATTGLSTEERRQRLQKNGPNQLPTEHTTPLWKQILAQFNNPIVLLLLGTAAAAGIVGEQLESLLILGIVIVMAVIGIILERQSLKSLASLKQYQVSLARVLSEGQMIEVKAETLVPGDILLLNEGDIISADARVLEAIDAQTDEATLTGESTPVSKSTKAVPEKTPLAEQNSMVFSGTSLLEGRIKAVVVTTGTTTQIGTIAQYLNQTKAEPTPLQLELQKLGTWLLAATVISSVALLGLYLVRGKALVESLLATIALAVAFVPESLSAVMTITLALAVTDMVKKKVIIKKLIAAEGLGSITHLATDKTGTMTEGKMQVAKVVLSGKVYDVSDKHLPKQPGYRHLIDVIRFCNNNQGPTEKALVSFLEKQGFSYELEGRWLEHRFTSSVKRMSVARKGTKSVHLFSKGAPDILIPLAECFLADRVKPFSSSHQQEALAQAEALASQGFRVLALAHREVKESDSHLLKTRAKAEQRLCFIGLIALMDPLRPTVKATVKGMVKAGVTPLMMTGDHPAIAQYIAEEAGLIQPRQSQLVLTGAELDQLLARPEIPANRQRLLLAKVFSRVRPDHKVLLVDFYQTNGFKLAMAGDGVNDTAAIKKANVGIAMSSGTSLAKEVADVVITGTYDALLRAVAIGRTVKLRTQLYFHFLLSGNMSEVGIFFVAVAFNWPLPFNALTILLINLITDALPALAMGMEPEDPRVLRASSKHQLESIMSPLVLNGILVQTIVTTILLGLVFYYSLPLGEVTARSILFSLYVMVIIARSFTARSFTRSLVQYGLLTNRLMNVAVIAAIGVWLVVAFMVPTVFGLTQLDIQTTVSLIPLALVPAMVEELLKWSNRRHLA